MLIVGLTGSIGMGKSTAAARFRENGISVFDADAEVHALYRGAAVARIEAAFPGSTEAGVVDRGRLLRALTSHADGFARLEAIVHPLVRAAEKAFLDTEAGRGADMAVLEIPLLFETGGDALVDVTVVVSAPPESQRERVVARPGMTIAKFEEILSRQLSDEEKRQLADFVVDTSGAITDTGKQIDSLVERLRGRAGEAYHRCWAGA